jgi:hypothetical protein
MRVLQILMQAFDGPGPTDGQGDPFQADGEPDEQPLLSWKPVRIEVALVAGYHPRGCKTLWFLVGRDGQVTRSLLRARLFPFNRRGYLAARKATKRFCRTDAPEGAGRLTTRVVVSGHWFAPEEVVEAWRLESRAQRPARFPFERRSP